MQRSKIGYQGWLIAMHRVLTNATGKGGLKLDRELGITQKSAWLLAYAGFVLRGPGSKGWLEWWGG